VQKAKGESISLIPVEIGGWQKKKSYFVKQ